MSSCCRSHFAFESVAQGNDGCFAADDFCVWFARRLVRIRQTHLGKVIQVCNSFLPIDCNALLQTTPLPAAIHQHCSPSSRRSQSKGMYVCSLSAFLHALPIGLFAGCPSSPSPASHHQCPQPAAHGRWRCCRAIPAPLHCRQTGTGQATRSQSVSRAPSIIQILDVKFLIDFPPVVGHSILKPHSE